MADETVSEATEGDGTEGHRLDRLESKVDHLAELVAKVLPSHAEAQQQQERHLDRPTDLQEQARAAVLQVQREERDQQAAKGAADAERADREDTRARLARLEERPPAPQRSPLAKLMTAGWGDGRA